MIQINGELCTKCQKCAKVCMVNIINEKDNEYPVIKSAENCFLCGHCLAVCPSKALSHSQLSYNNLVDTADITIESEKMRSFLASKRSCRFYKKQSISPETWQTLLKAVSYSPTAFNCEERAVTVVSDKEVLAAIRKAILKKSKGIIKLFNSFRNAPLKWMFNKKSIHFFNRLCLDFEETIKKCENGRDGLFHDAPYLVIISSVGMDTMGKDYTTAAAHYMMLQAQSLGIGSAINGFCQNYPEIIGKYVKLPEMHKAFTVFTMGYPAMEFKRTVERQKVPFNMI